MAAVGSAPIRVAGDRLGSAAELEAGPGAFVRGSSVFASVSGHERRERTAGQAKETVQILSPKAQALLPQVGALVLAQVSRVSARVANVDIVGINGKASKEKFAGIVRQQDVRATEIDKVDLHHCFRPGDLILAKVLSLGDARAYYLSTASNELGVVFARSIAGAAMVPVSWQEMGCPLTGQKEFRKVAKTGDKGAAPVQ